MQNTTYYNGIYLNNVLIIYYIKRQQPSNVITGIPTSVGIHLYTVCAASKIYKR